MIKEFTIYHFLYHCNLYVRQYKECSTICIRGPYFDMTSTLTLVQDPCLEMTDDEVDALPDDDPTWLEFRQHMRSCQLLDDSIKSMGLYSTYELVGACVKSGYNPEADGTRVSSWLINYIVTAINKEKEMNNDPNNTETTGDELPLTEDEMDTLQDWPEPDSWGDKDE